MTSKTTVLAVVILLGIAALMGMGGIIGLAAFEKAVPESLTALTAGAIGAIAGLLGSTRSTLGKNDVEPTVIQGAQAIEPAHVTEDPLPYNNPRNIETPLVPGF